MTYLGGLTVSENASAPIFLELSRRPVGGANGLWARFRRLMNKAGIYAPLRVAKGGNGRVFRALSFHSLRPIFRDPATLLRRPIEVRIGAGRPQLRRNESKLHAGFPSFDGVGHRSNPKRREGG
jgi:hypothetical protein